MPLKATSKSCCIKYGKHETLGQLSCALVNFSISGFGRDMNEIHQALIPLVEVSEPSHLNYNESRRVITIGTRTIKEP